MAVGGQEDPVAEHQLTQCLGVLDSSWDRGQADPWICSDCVTGGEIGFEFVEIAALGSQQPWEVGRVDGFVVDEDEFPDAEPCEFFDEDAADTAKADDGDALMRLLAAGHRVALTRGGHTLVALALAARDLKDGRRTAHPELVLFASWGELQEYADHDPAGRDLQPFVELVDQHGPEAIITAVHALTDEDKADVTVSTAHKAKGREWPAVKIADDFPPPPDSDQHDDRGRPIPEP